MEGLLGLHLVRKKNLESSCTTSHVPQPRVDRVVVRFYSMNAVKMDGNKFNAKS